jgi:hypothetical protein
MQDDDISYTILMEKIQEKKCVLNGWLSTPSPPIFHQHADDNSNSLISISPYAWGPSLSKYIHLTSNNTFGAFIVDTKNRQTAEENCRFYIERFLFELERRFSISKVQESLCTLFDPAHLHKNQQHIRQIGYGREQLAFLSKKYNRLDGFAPDNVANEWESLRPSLVSYLAVDGKNRSRRLFWKEFVLLQQAMSITFADDYKNIMQLVSVYLISPTNSAECERGYSASNRIQTNGRSRLMIDTLNCLLTVRLLLPDDIRRYAEEYEKKYLFRYH